MSKKNKHPNKIDLLESMRIFQAYGLKPHSINFYQIRLQDDESGHIWDWYHTTGTLVRVIDGSQKSAGIYRESEDVAIVVRRKEDALA